MIDKTVRFDIPTSKVYKNTKNGKTYLLYEVGYVYVPEKKYNKKLRVAIGQVCEDDPTKFHPNRNYYEQYPGAVKGGEAVVETQVTVRRPVVKVGMYVVMKQLLAKLQLEEFIDSLNGDDRGLLLDLVAYMITERTNDLEHYEDYCKSHVLFTKGKKCYSDSMVRDFLDGYRYENVQHFFETWQSIHQTHDATCYVVYDSTSVAVAYDFKTNLPVLNEAYSGLIPDDLRLEEFVNTLRRIGYQNVVWLLDSNSCSRESLTTIRDFGCNYIVIHQKACDSLRMHRGTFENIYQYRIGTKNVFGLSGKTLSEENYHLYYDPAKFSQEQEDLYQFIDKIRDDVTKKVGTNTMFSKSYDEYLDVIRDGKDNVIEACTVKEDAINEAVITFGYFELRTDTNLSSEEVYELYKRKEAIEEAFYNTPTCALNHALDSKMENFLSFIARIVYLELYNTIDSYKKEHDIKQHSLTVQSFIMSVENIKVSKNEVGEYKLVASLTAEQKNLLEVFGIDAESMELVIFNALNQ